MEINKFLENFQSQLEDVETSINASTNYVKADFWDSLTAMVVKVMIEDEYEFDIPVEKINSFNSILELFDYIKLNANK